jgi:hypothetical protein
MPIVSADGTDSFAGQKVFARPSDQPKQYSTYNGRHVDNPPVVVIGGVLKDEHAHQGDPRQPRTKRVQEVSQSSEHPSLFLSPALGRRPRQEKHFRRQLCVDTGQEGRQLADAIAATTPVGEAADAFAANVPLIPSNPESGVSSIRGVAKALSARGIKTARGGEWTVQVSDILRRGE